MPALIERRKMTRATYQALKRHILGEREKRKLEQEADLALERQRKEAERRKRLENENKNSLQQTKDELIRLDKQLEDHKKEKSKLFAQLKRILESENTKKVNEKKHETQLYPSGGQSGPPNPPMHFLSGTGHMGRPVMFKPALHPGLPQSSSAAHSGSSTSQVKRRSPSPANNHGVPSNVFQFHPNNQSGGMYGSAKYGPSQEAAGGYSAYPHHQPSHQNKAGNNLKQTPKSQKSGQPQLLGGGTPSNPAEPYQNRQTIGHMLQQTVQHALDEEKTRGPAGPHGTPQRHPQTPHKGSIVTGATGYSMHGTSQSHQSRGTAAHSVIQNLTPGRPPYSREGRPYYQ